MLVEKIIKISLEEINQFQDAEDQIDINFNDIFIGPNGKLDSLSTATFLIELENAFFSQTGKRIDFTEKFIGEEGINIDYYLKDIKTIIENEF